MNDKTRREFLKNCFQIGGYAGIACLGMGAIDDARGWGILPAVVTSGGGNTSWADWDETTESGWGDSANTYIALMENKSAGGNEVGQGAELSEANRTLTQSGNIAGAALSGGYWRRAIDAGDDRFIPTVGWCQGIMENVTWIIVQKMYITTVGVNDGYLGLRSNVGGGIYCLEATSKMATTWADPATPQTTTDNIPTGIVYMFWGYDGTNTRSGFSITKPTSWAAIPANQKCSDTEVRSWGPGDDWNLQTRSLFARPDQDTSIDGFAYFVVASTSWSSIIGV